jgi:serine/threonine-protein phosphatase 2B catalytic subunit
LNIQQFNYTPHPYWLPSFMDVFTWSLPFIAEHLNQMMVKILEKEEDTDDDDDIIEDDKTIHREILKNKVRFISKMAVLQKNLRLI